MARATKKYKREDDVPERKSKIRKTLKVKDEYDYVESDDNSDTLFVIAKNKSKHSKKQQQKVKESEATEKVTADEQYENEESRTESQVFLDMLAEQSKNNKQAAKAAKEFFRTFCQSIEETTKRLKNQIKDQTHLSAQNSTRFLASFKTAYAYSRPSCPRDDATDGFVFASLYSRTQDLISRAQFAIDQFEAADAKIKDLDPRGLLTNIKWGEQIWDVEKLLQLGQQVGLKKYDAMVKGRLEEQDNESLEDVDLGRIYSHEEAHEGISWGVLAQKQMKALRKVIKAANHVSMAP